MRSLWQIVILGATVGGAVGGVGGAVWGLGRRSPYLVGKTGVVALFAAGKAVIGVLLVLSAILTMAGKTKPGPVWLPRWLSGTSQLGIGIFSFLTGIFPNNILAFMVAVAAFIVAAVSVLLLFVKWLRRRPEQGWPH